MSIETIIIEAVLAIWYIVPVIIILVIVKTPWFKGILGEFIVNLMAKFLLNNKTYHRINNVTLPTNNGTTQIDHIFVSVYGVFVVETKNMKGWIFGSQQQKMWTQQIYKHTQKFQNPLHQNYKHVKTLQDLLNLETQQLHSLVVFVGNSVFKTNMPKNVTQGYGYIRYIKAQNKKCLSENQVQTIIKQIENGRYPRNLQTQRSHINHVNTIVSERDKQSSICPQCGSEMILRTVKKGKNAGKQFWGCSRYPSCRGIIRRL